MPPVTLVNVLKRASEVIASAMTCLCQREASHLLLEIRLQVVNLSLQRSFIASFIG
jgi:hypothetical protein